MVIILDLSGSVIGNRLLIIKSAILKLLDTLQENDFVSIICFNKNAHYLKNCWDHLVQATERNKKILKAAIKSDSVDGKNVANVDKGFKLAFQTLENARKPNTENRTSKCTQTIAFFSDGVEGDTVAEDVFKQYNGNKEVRVFTYLVGRENGSPFEALKWIACNNRGFFYRIETLSDVRQTMVKYLTVLSRSRSSKPKWTPLYLDALGLGMTSALVVPIFDKTNNKKQLGVLGSDVRLDEILSNFPEPHLGSGGYPFIITNNGLVFYHPLLKTEEGAGLKHPANVYISELLHHFDNPDKTETLAKDMINGEVKEPSFADKDFQEFLVLAKYNNKFRIVKRKLSYSYKKISSDTSFSVGTAVTDYGSKLIDESVGDGAITAALKQLKERNVNISIAKKWPYCSKPINDWEELKTSLTNSKCTGTDDLTNLVKYDITKLGNQYTGWMPKKPSLSEVQAIFFGTTSGLTFYNSAGENATFSTSIKQEYFERAADSWKERTIIFSAASQNEAHASRAVVGKDNVLWGVVGIHMNSTYLKQIVNENHNMCETDEGTFCYLVDENGYIVSSKKEEKNGEFFGAVEGNVMRDLINQSVYEKYNFTDVQATCEPTPEESSSSIRLLDPFFSVVNYAKWWTQTIAL
ncbi:voltage-dependent calcium channel subunit alpha-2 delta-4 [Paramuricea clavata]|uniref:Voltage-dependent calcium channel subunit alpha-2 delta-4 n=1 Tax=Paramuricea clavata TaxID=317549 RepID=A0A6S7GCG1_PARCT|nr:voltage-dependent calcium channel subunit alpha-2 delta-4 [Paramuricea clavata]